MIDVYITTLTRQQSALKAWKYAHSAIHTVTNSPTLVLHGHTAIFVQGIIAFHVWK